MPRPTRSFRVIAAMCAMCLGPVPSKAEDARQLLADLEKIEATQCQNISTDPVGAVQDVAPHLTDNVISNLVVEAILRFCGSTGAIEAPERIVRDETRNVDPSADLTEDQSAILRHEAEYHLEVASSIDPDAANDLLRRLLGNDPKPSR